MIKKLIVAATFAGSLMVGVPSASASPFLCMQQYEADMTACEGDEPCETYANLTFTSCLQALQEIKS